jgi:uncharacterized membrane protein
MTMSKHWRLVLLGVAFPSLAFAYIDPGTGAYVVQGAIALVSTVVFYAAHPGRLFKRVWGRFFKDRASSDTE